MEKENSKYNYDDSVVDISKFSESDLEVFNNCLTQFKLLPPWKQLELIEKTKDIEPANDVQKALQNEYINHFKGSKALDYTKAYDVESLLGVYIGSYKVDSVFKEKCLPSFENCYVSVEMPGGFVDKGRTQSFADCINDVEYDCIDNMVAGQKVSIYGENGKLLAECSIVNSDLPLPDRLDYRLQIDYKTIDRKDVLHFNGDIEYDVYQSQNSLKKAAETAKGLFSNVAKAIADGAKNFMSGNIDR